MSYASEVLADNPLFWLPMSETSGTLLANAGSIGGNATAHGALTLGQAAPPGLQYAVSFPGATTAYIDYPDNSSLDLTGDMTYECWLNPANISNIMALISKGKGVDANSGYELRMTNTGTLQMLKAYIAVLATSTGALTASVWNYCAVTRSGNTYTFYIAAVSAGGGTDATVIDANNAPLTVGVNINNQISTSETPVNGLLASPAIYGAPLSQARITAHFQAGIAPGQPQVLLPHSVSAALRT